MDVHPTAVIAKGAVLGKNVRIGPFCVIGPLVRLGDDCRLHSHVVIDGDTEIGPNCEFWPHVVLGTPAQHRDADAAGLRPQLRIGANNRFREHVTANTGTATDRCITRIGNNNFLLAGAHVAHDVTIGDHVTMTNGALLAGHTVIEDRAIIGALVGLHQFARVGQLAMIGAGAMLTRDAPPFSLVQGDRARIRGINVIGMKRAGHGQEDITAVKRAFRALFWRKQVFAARVDQVRSELGDHPLVGDILRFLRDSKRGVLMARKAAEFDGRDE